MYCRTVLDMKRCFYFCINLRNTYLYSMGVEGVEMGSLFSPRGTRHRKSTKPCTFRLFFEGARTLEPQLTLRLCSTQPVGRNGFFSLTASIWHRLILLKILHERFDWTPFKSSITPSGTNELKWDIFLVYHLIIEKKQESYLVRSTLSMSVAEASESSLARLFIFRFTGAGCWKVLV